MAYVGADENSPLATETCPSCNRKHGFSRRVKRILCHGKQTRLVLQRERFFLPRWAKTYFRLAAENVSPIAADYMPSIAAEMVSCLEREDMSSLAKGGDFFAAKGKLFSVLARCMFYAGTSGMLSVAAKHV